MRKVQFSEHKIRVRAEAQDSRCCVCGRTGVGIAKEDLPRLFQDFARAKRSPRVSGCGMGLAISRRIVEVHGGSITVESEPAKAALL